jgi:hypothetical protein
LKKLVWKAMPSGTIMNEVVEFCVYNEGGVFPLMGRPHIE